MTVAEMRRRLIDLRQEQVANELDQAALASDEQETDPFGSAFELDDEETEEERELQKRRHTLYLRGEEILREIKRLERQLRDMGVKV